LIYFIECNGHIKIGFATNVERRLLAMRTANPLLVRLGSMEGSMRHEKAIHVALSKYRIKGSEWFKDCPEVREFLINAMNNGVEEWKPKERSFTPSMWDERAKKLCAIVCTNRPQTEHQQIEQEYSIPAGTLFALKYRQFREIYVGEYFALLTAARESIRRRQEEINRDLAFVADLEREEAEGTAALSSVVAELKRLEAAQ